MSFRTGGTVRFTVRTNYHSPTQHTREFNPTKMRIHRDAAILHLQGKERVHKISGDLARSIEVETITSERARNAGRDALRQNRGGQEGQPENCTLWPHGYMKQAA
jgi:hypothetical protein